METKPKNTTPSDSVAHAVERIDVIMLATPKIDYYASQTSAGWRAYCSRHGYEFKVYREQVVADMHVVRSKVAVFRGHMRDSRADWVVLVDADTRVNRPELRLESLIYRYAQHKEFLISEDCSRRFGLPIPLSLKSLKMSGSWRAPNSGFMMVRNTPSNADVFDEWLTNGRGPFAAIADIFPREQAVFWASIYKKYRGRIAVIGDEIMRVGINATIDRFTMDSRRAFIHHDKRLTNGESA
jgi:hypothetical protein